MRRKRPFNNQKVSELLTKYLRHKKDTVLRDRIIKLTLPLIDAAISRKRFYRNREDLKQECVIKLLYALPKYDPSRGKAFAFLWTTICNTCTTQDQRMSHHDLSLSSDEDVQKEAETNGRSLFETPENRHILNLIGESLVRTLEGVEISNSRKHRRACRSIKQFLITGELFYEKPRLVRRLKRLGLDRREIQLYVDRTMVLVRERLLEARENATALEIREVGTVVPKDSDT